MLMRACNGANSTARLRTCAASAALPTMCPVSPAKVQRDRKLPRKTTEAWVANWLASTARVFSAPAPLTAHWRSWADRSSALASSTCPAQGTRKSTGPSSVARCASPRRSSALVTSPGCQTSCSGYTESSSPSPPRVRENASTRAPLCSSSRQRARPMPELRSEEHTSELQSRENLVCRLLLEKKKERE